MAINGISYESGELINEVKEEIALYGGAHSVFAVCRAIGGEQIITDYFLYEAEMREARCGLAADETAVRTTLAELLRQLEQQDAVI